MSIVGRHRERTVDPDAGAARRVEARQLPIDLRVRPWYNPDLRTSRFIIPGLIAIILTFTLIQFTASAIVRERERGTLEQLQVTPATRVEMILGKILPFIVIGYIQLTLTILMMRYLFQIVIQGSVLELYVVGLPLHRRGARPRHADLDGGADADAGDADVDVLPAAVRLPVGLRLPDRRHAAGSSSWLSRVIPARYFIEVLRGVILRGAGIAELWRPVAWLASTPS